VDDGRDHEPAGVLMPQPNDEREKRRLRVGSLFSGVLPAQASAALAVLVMAERPEM
jgi:hypothetical protein